MAQLSPTPRGLFPRMRAALFGDRTARLTEQLHSTSWLSYLLVVTQSVAVVLVLGHAQIPLLFSADWIVRGIVAAALFVLVASVYAADLCFLATIKRIPVLARNRQTTAQLEHLLYAGFVLSIEGSTYGVVVATLDRDPHALLNPAPLVPVGGPLFLALVIGRVVLLCWSTVQLFITSGKLPPQLTTLMATGREIVGAHVERQLAALDLEHTTLAGSFQVYAAMSKPPRRVRTLLNGWLVRRDAHREAEEERQAQLVINALEAFDLANRAHTYAARLPAPSTPVGPRDPLGPFPTGPGTPLRQGVRTPSSALELRADEEADEAPNLGVRTRRPAASTRAKNDAIARRRRLRLIEARVREIQAAGGEVVVRDLVRWLRRQEHSRVSESTVNGLLQVVLERLAQEAVRTGGQVAQ